MPIAVIPARYAATRLPGKPLLLIGGKSLIRHVYERVAAMSLFSEVIVATDDERIRAHVADFGGRVVLTRADHPSGTDRVAEVVADRTDADIVVNVQGDEPFVAEAQLATLLAAFRPGVDIATLARRIDEAADLESTATVKVVFDQKGRALYFSRLPIPHLRDVPAADRLDKGLHYHHVGLYAYRRETLLALTQLPPAPYEIAEGLEQLRWLQAGYAVHVAITDLPSIGIDTPHDLERAGQIIANS